jgi:hypothetical protein
MAEVETMCMWVYLMDMKPSGYQGNTEWRLTVCLTLYK